MCQTTLTYNIGGHLHEIGTRLVGRGPRRRWMLFTHIGIEIHHLLGKCAIEREDGKDKGWARGRRDGGNGRSESNCEEGLVVILLTSRCYVGNSRSVSLPGSDVKLRVLVHQAAHATVHAKTMGPAHPPGLHRRHCSNVPGCVKHWLHCSGCLGPVQLAQHGSTQIGSSSGLFWTLPQARTNLGAWNVVKMPKWTALKFR